MSNYPQKFTNWALDIVFPKICLGCGKFTNKSDFDYICRKCFGEITIKNTFECIGCKKETRFGLTCSSCKKENQTDQTIIAAELSDPTVDKLLKTYKYKFICDLSKPLSVIAKKSIKNLLNKGLNLFTDNPLIVSVPLHRTRFNWRGFNQSELLAKNISDTYHISYSRDILIKIYNIKHQADISVKEDRVNNIKNNFVVVNVQAVKNRTLILVDDICTTGATLNECARILKESGAKRVTGFVIARG